MAYRRFVMTSLTTYPKLSSARHKELQLFIHLWHRDGHHSRGQDQGYNLIILWVVIGCDLHIHKQIILKTFGHVHPPQFLSTYTKKVQMNLIFAKESVQYMNHWGFDQCHVSVSSFLVPIEMLMKIFTVTPNISKLV